MKAKYFALQAGGRKFESCYPDHFKNPVKIFAGFFLSPNNDLYWIDRILKLNFDFLQKITYFYTLSLYDLG